MNQIYLLEYTSMQVIHRAGQLGSASGTDNRS